jgi:hypothetical protein
MDKVVDWLVGLSPSGIVEFAPNNYAMVQELLRLREDVFDDCNEASFLQSLEFRVRVTNSKTIASSGRCLICFER